MVQAVSSKKRAAKFLFHHYLTECRKHLLEFSHKIVTHQTEFNQAGSIATQFLDPETTQQTKSKARFFLDASSSYWESKIKNLTAQNKAFFTRNSQFWISVHNYFRLSRRLHLPTQAKSGLSRFFIAQTQNRRFDLVPLFVGLNVGACPRNFEQPPSVKLVG